MQVSLGGATVATVIVVSGDDFDIPRVIPPWPAEVGRLFELSLHRPLTIDDVMKVAWPKQDRTQLIDGMLVVTPLLEDGANSRGAARMEIAVALTKETPKDRGVLLGGNIIAGENLLVVDGMVYQKGAATVRDGLAFPAEAVDLAVLVTLPSTRRRTHTLLAQVYQDAGIPLIVVDVINGKTIVKNYGVVPDWADTRAIAAIGFS